MGYYRVSYSDLESSCYQIKKQMFTAVRKLGYLRYAIRAMRNSNSLEGETAEAIRRHWWVVGEVVIPGIMRLCIAHYSNFQSYKMKYNIFDSHWDAFFNTGELEEIQYALESNKRAMNYHRAQAEAVLSSVSDLVTASVLYHNDMRSITVKKNEKCAEKIEEIEIGSGFSEFSETEGLMYCMRAIVRNMRSSGGNVKAFSDLSDIHEKRLNIAIENLVAAQAKTAATLKEWKNSPRYDMYLKSYKTRPDAVALERQEIQLREFKLDIIVAAVVYTLSRTIFSILPIRIRPNLQPVRWTDGILAPEGRIDFDVEDPDPVTLDSDLMRKIGEDGLNPVKHYTGLWAWTAPAECIVNVSYLI